MGQDEVLEDPAKQAGYFWTINSNKNAMFIKLQTFTKRKPPVSHSTVLAGGVRNLTNDPWAI